MMIKTRLSCWESCLVDNLSIVVWRTSQSVGGHFCWGNFDSILQILLSFLLLEVQSSWYYCARVNINWISARSNIRLMQHSLVAFQMSDSWKTLSHDGKNPPPLPLSMMSPNSILSSLSSMQRWCHHPGDSNYLSLFVLWPTILRMDKWCAVFFFLLIRK